MITKQHHFITLTAFDPQQEVHLRKQLKTAFGFIIRFNTDIAAILKASKTIFKPINENKHPDTEQISTSNVARILWQHLNNKGLIQKAEIMDTLSTQWSTETD